ncbi:hypothetical protein HYS93_02695 [Candidatus Daviesbacteria bacterium]|nr:hypothetical protein [Candidatus Daviesbacteria bacterium]
MIKRLPLFISLIVIFSALLFSNGGLNFLNKNTAYAIGDLTVNWGIGSGDVGPIFNISNMAPGQTETRSVTVTNGAISNRPVGIKALKTTGLGGLENKLDVVISKGATDLYGGTLGTKTLADFFSDSAGINFVSLTNLGPTASDTYDIKVTFDSGADNSFQNTSVTFDLKIGIAIAVPTQCDNIAFSSAMPIFGTSGNNTLRGTSGNDLIFAFEGNDTVYGGGGDDCIVGGEGNDTLRGETGNDRLFGEGGNDSLIGGVGNDQIFGGDGKDTIRGEDGNDQLEGGGGGDNILGGAGSDQIKGGSGNDTLSGESGNDNIEGNEDDDKLIGGAGNDQLLGNDGSDSSNGQSGTDTCNSEIEISCEL